jgi:hypothetical protein
MTAIEEVELHCIKWEETLVLASLRIITLAIKYFAITIVKMGFLYSQLCVRLPYPSQSFNGQTVIVTGSNTGLGLEAARHFTRLGASKVILAVRSISKGQEAQKSIEQTTHRLGVCEVWQLDSMKPVSLCSTQT